MIPLFSHYPRLKEKLPYIELCNLPTPIIKLEKLGQQLGIDQLYIKQDGLTSDHYGGNKVRKLEFLLGEAKVNNYKKVVTFGFSGSNHATATAIHAKRLGMKSVSMLAAQENAEYVRRNLLLSYTGNAEIHHYDNRPKRDSGLKYQKIKHLLLDRKSLYTIPSGGSSPLGIAGFVNAAYELKFQMHENLLPEPDFIYVAMGSAGSAIGLHIGLSLLGMKTKLIPVRVIEHNFTDEDRIRSAFDDTVSFLNKCDPSIPRLDFNFENFPVNENFLGKGYAKFTEECINAVNRLKETEGILLDGTYTGKAMAALINDASSGALRKKTILFWNTLNANDFSNRIKDLDYRLLPKQVHYFFETDVQDETAS